MVGLYIGSTFGYSGKNLVAMAMGMKFQKEGLRVGYMKPVGALPTKKDDKPGDDDAFFIQEVLGIQEDPALVTPVLVNRDFRVNAFLHGTGDLIQPIAAAYQKISKDKDIVIIAGSGSFLHSGIYCGVEGTAVAKALDAKVVIVDRYTKETNYDYLAAVKRGLGADMIGAILNDIPDHFMSEVDDLIKPLLTRLGVDVLGVVPRDPLMGAIGVGDLANKLGGKVISVSSKSDRLVENFLIGTMHVENFLTHFKRRRNAAVIVGGDRADLQLVAIEGNCPCIVLTGNLYPNDITMTRAEVMGVPLIVVSDDTFTVAKKMEFILGSQKLRENMKINRGAQLVNSSLDYQLIKQKLGL